MGDAHDFTLWEVGPVLRIPMTRAATHYNEVRRSENRSGGPG